MTAPRAALLAVLCAAAFLRLPGLDQGVRRGSAAGDEIHNFVSPIRQMWSKPTANPTVRPGYPGFFNVLAFLPVGVGDRLAGERGAYVGARGLVAVFGLANVFLVYLVGRALAGEWAGVFAAALLALSRGEVSHAHFITPDLLVITGVLALLLLLARTPLTDRRAVLAGVVCGLAIAVKYTAVVALPAAAVVLLRDERRVRHGLLLAGAALAAFAVAAPYALLGASPQGSGIVQAVRDYYSAGGYAGEIARREGQGRGSAAARLLTGYVGQNLGLAGLALALVGLVARGVDRVRGPLVAALAAALALAAPAMVIYPRHVLVPSALLALLAGCGLFAVDGWLRPRGDRVRRVLVAALAALALVPLGRSAFALAARFRAPDALDRAGTWIEAALPGHALVATAYPRFALAGRIEVRYWSRPIDTPLTEVPPSVLRHYDAVVGPAADVDALARAGARWRAVERFSDGAEVTTVALPEPVPEVRVEPTSFAASEDDAAAPGPWRASGAWRSATGAGWLAGLWEAPRTVTRLEVVADPAGGFTPQGVRVEGREEAGASWQRLHAWALRPRTLSAQDPAVPHGQVFVPDPPAPVVAVRVIGRGAVAWGLSRVSVFAAPVSGPAPARSPAPRGGP